MNHRAGEGKATATICYLLTGVQGIGEARVARWFVSQGQRLRANDPLVLLQSGGDGPSITLRVSRQDSIAGSVVERIFCSEGARVTQSDCLAVFTASSDEIGWPIDRVEDLGDLGQYPVAYVDYVLASDSRSRELLDRLFPGYVRWYFQTYPLMPRLQMVGTLAILGLGALVMHSTLDLLAALNGETSSTPWWDNLWLVLSPFFLGTLVFLSLLVLRWLELSRVSQRRRTSRRRQAQK